MLLPARWRGRARTTPQTVGTGLFCGGWLIATALMEAICSAPCRGSSLLLQLRHRTGRGGGDDITFVKACSSWRRRSRYRRGMIYNVNPVGVVSFGLAAGLSICAFFGLGATLAPFSRDCAGLAFVAAP